MATINNGVVQGDRVDTEANWLAASVANRTIYPGETVFSTDVAFYTGTYTGEKTNGSSSNVLFESIPYKRLFNGNDGGSFGDITISSLQPELKMHEQDANSNYNSMWFLVSSAETLLQVRSSAGVFYSQPLKIVNSNSLTSMKGVYDNTTASAANIFINSSGDMLRSTSSIRSKKDLLNIVNETQEIDLEKILDIDIVTFDSIVDDVDTRFFGVTAEKLHELFGHYLVTYDNEGKPDAVQYDRLGPLVIAYLQKKQFDERIKVLEEENTSIKARLDALEA